MPTFRFRRDEPNTTVDETNFRGGDMNEKPIPAQAGLEWLLAGLQVWGRCPRAMAVVAVACAVAAIVPVAGGLVLALVAPVAYGGLVRWLDSRAQDSPTGPPAAVMEGSLWQRLLVLSAPLLALWLLGWLLGALFIPAEAQVSAVAGKNLALARLGIGTLLLPVVMLVVLLGVLMVLFFSIPAVALRGANPVQAMRDSWQTSMRNLAPLLMLAGALILVMLVVSAILANRAPGPAFAGIMAVLLHPWLAASIWAADDHRRRED